MVISPMGLWLLAYTYFGFCLGNPGWAGDVLARMAFGWKVLGAWGVGVGIWGVWWPGWVVVAALAMTGEEVREGEGVGQGGIEGKG